MRHKPALLQAEWVCVSSTLTGQNNPPWQTGRPCSHQELLLGSAYSSTQYNSPYTLIKLKCYELIWGFTFGNRMEKWKNSWYWVNERFNIDVYITLNRNNVNFFTVRETCLTNTTHTTLFVSSSLSAKQNPPDPNVWMTLVWAASCSANEITTRSPTQRRPSATSAVINEVPCKLLSGNLLIECAVVWAGLSLH